MLAVHMDQALCSRTLVQIIDILRDDGQLAAPRRIEPRQRGVCCIGLGRLNRGAAHVIETVDQVGIARERLRRRDVLDAVLFP